MDQDDFRSLLSRQHSSITQSSSGSGSKHTKSQVRGQSSSKQSDATPSAQSAFKPRKVAQKKKEEQDYRDRASERRQGINDYADVEAVLENFEKRTANNKDREAVETQRRYLGGDEKHTVLVKGLDFALLEQTKARLESNPEMDDALEEAFVSSAAGHTGTQTSKKRTREDIVRELKQKRGDKSSGEAMNDPTESSPVDDALTRAKQMGKFKPIGAPASETKSKSKEGGERRKKKRKVAIEAAATATPTEKPSSHLAPSVDALTLEEQVSNTPDATSSTVLNNPVEVAQAVAQSPPEPEDDMDIFADVGDYEGLDLSDDDEGQEGISEKRKISVAPDAAARGPGNWFGDTVEVEQVASGPGLSSAVENPTSTNTENKEDHPVVDESHAARLAPLATSAVPSIRDILAADKALEAEEKKKARKEKMKKKNKE